MSEDQEDTAKERYLVQHYVPKSEFDATHRNIELRVTSLGQRISGLQTQVDAVDRSVNNMVARQDKVERRINALEAGTADVQTELRVSKQERISMLSLLQMLDRKIDDTERAVDDTAINVGKIRHMQALGWMLMIVLIVAVLLKVW